jgi:hypothetical protein
MPEKHGRIEPRQGDTHLMECLGHEGPQTPALLAMS